MDIECPSCHKVNRLSRPEDGNMYCKRCGGDLTKLFKIALTAKHKTDEAKIAILKRNPDTALFLAEESWRLKHSAEAAKLAFLASVAKKNYTLACAWYLRSCT